MPIYTVIILPSALRALSVLPTSLKKRIKEKIDELAFEPKPLVAKKLQGIKGQYRLRVGDYRVIYSIENETLTIVVVKVGHRREVYRAMH